MDDNKEQIKLLLLPYAGGSALFYSRWVKYLSKHIKMVPIELPGRGIHLFLHMVNLKAEGKLRLCIFAFFLFIRLNW